MNVTCTISKIYKFYKKFPEHIGSIYVDTPYGNKRIIACEIIEKNAESFLLKTLSFSLICSPDHRVKDEYGNWVFVKNLKISNNIQTKKGHEQVIECYKLPLKYTLYDIQVEEVEQYYSNGILSHNSSCLEPITFALFGKLNRSVKKEQIVNWKNRKNCEVKIRFKKNNDIFTIIRGIKPDKLEIYRNNDPIPPLSDVRLYQKQLETEILDIDFNTFVSIVHTNLNTLTPILKMDTQKKRAFLERVFGLNIYTKINEKSNEKLNVINNKIHELNIEIRYNEKKSDELKFQLTQLKDKQRNMISSKKEMDGIIKKINDIDVTEEDLRLIDDKIYDLKQSIEKNTTRKGTLEISKSISVTKEENINFKIHDMRKKKENADKYIKAFDLYNNRIKEYGESDKLNIELSLLMSELSILCNEIDNMKEKCSILNGKRYSNKKHYDEIIKKLDNLKGKDICPTCGSIISFNGFSSSFTEQATNLKEDILKIDNDIKYYTEQLQYMLQNKDVLSTKIETLKSIIKEIIDIKNECIKYEEYRDFSLEIKELEDSLLTIQNIIMEMNNRLKDITSEISNDKEVLSILNNEYGVVVGKLKLLNELNNKLQTLREKVLFEDKVNDEISRNIYDLESNIKVIIEKIDEDVEKVNKFNNIIDYLEQIKLLCKDENVKQFAISSIMPFLTKQVNHYLAEGGCNFYLKFTGWLEEEILGPGITNCSYGNLSGGEARSIDLALQLAFLDILRLQAAIFPDIIIFDEILDSSIDASGLHNLLKIIRSKQREDNSKVFLITHRSEITNLEIDTVYMVNKINGYSQVILNDNL